MSPGIIKPAGVLAFVLALAPLFGADDKLIGGNGTLYLGGRPNRIFLIDEATEKVIGEIKTKTGSPTQLTLSQDKKRFYASNMSFEDIEIIDIASRQVIDNFRLSEGNKKARIFGFEPDPLNRFIIVMTKTATKQVDRFEIGRAHAAAVRSERAQGNPHHPVAQGRRTRIRKYPFFARRQTALLFWRRHSDLRHHQLQAGG